MLWLTVWMAFPLRITPLLHRQAENTSFPVFCFPLQIIGSRACHKALFIRLAESKVLSTTNDKSAVVISAKIVLRLLGWQCNVFSAEFKIDSLKHSYISSNLWEKFWILNVQFASGWPGVVNNLLVLNTFVVLTSFCASAL